LAEASYLHWKEVDSMGHQAGDHSSTIRSFSALIATCQRHVPFLIPLTELWRNVRPNLDSAPEGKFGRLRLEF